MEHIPVMRILWWMITGIMIMECLDFQVLHMGLMGSHILKNSLSAVCVQNLKNIEKKGLRNRSVKARRKCHNC